RKHRVDLVECERDWLVSVAHEAGDAWRVTNRAPRLISEIHANQHVAGHAHANDLLALAILDLADLFERDLDLEDELLHVQALDTVLNGLLHALLVARVAVDDEPVTLAHAELCLELDGGFGLFGGLRLRRFDFSFGLGRC